MNLFETNANMTALSDICALYIKWWWIPFAIFLVVAAFTHNDKLKSTMLGCAGFALVVFIGANNIDVLQATFQRMAEWFGGSSSLT